MEPTATSDMEPRLSNTGRATFVTIVAVAGASFRGDARLCCA
jgi:hypothetical protein